MMDYQGGSGSYGRRGRQRDGQPSADQYLIDAVKTASPAKLRLMLLDRSVELARMIAWQWRDQPDSAGENEQSLTLLDFLGELLSGVTSDETEVCTQVADLYVFLTKHLIAAEQNGDAGAIDEIRLVLETEAETWRMVVANEAPDAVKRQFKASEVAAAADAAAAALPATENQSTAPEKPKKSGSLNLQA